MSARPAAGLRLTERTSPATLDEALLSGGSLPRWIGWRLRILVGLVLGGCVLIFMLAQWLAVQPRLPVGLRGSSEGLVKIVSSTTPALQRLEGLALEGLRLEARGAQGETTVLRAPIDLLALQRSARWIPRQADVQAYLQTHHEIDRLQSALPPGGGTVVLELVNAPDEPVLIAPRGWAGLPALFWVLSALGLVTAGVGAVVVLASPQWRNVAFSVLALSQAGHLMFMASETALDLFIPVWLIVLDAQLRTVFDLAVGAALVQVAVLHPRKHSAWPWFGALGVLVALGVGLGLTFIPETWRWWWVQGGASGLVLTAIGLMTLTYWHSPHPFTIVLRRFSLITLSTWALLCVSVAMSSQTRPDMALNVTTFGVMTWHVFFASQLLLAPYLSRSRQILQEFSLLAASSTVAASLDLIFVAVFTLGQFTAMTLSLFLALGVYLSVRRWVMTNLLNRDPITTERLFERLYRIARELERHPEQIDTLMARLVKELFDPLECTLVPGDVPQCGLRGNGGTLLVPLPRLLAGDSGVHKVFVLHHADKGRRLFTSEDARLAERIVDQLQRVLTFDRAVEKGRSEERMRLAQDLHDDIGARLLTLMYQAPNPDIEDYIRHTLQDLKTLTRGLAVLSNTLQNAASEWKLDLTHRLQVARCELDWSLSCDEDIELTVVQWSALTRILRELVNNTISHAQATRVSISLSLHNDRLRLEVRDNGIGRAPETWSHGLGLGGVRKRVKQLGGSVVWRENAPQGIACEVVVERFSAGQPA